MPDDFKINIDDSHHAGQRPSRAVVVQAISVSPDLVFGRIQWKRALGLPEGDLDKAFYLDCYHWDRVKMNEDQKTEQQRKRLSTPRYEVDVWAGPHDDRYFRVTFLTSAQLPQGYDIDSGDPLRTLNLLDVSFRTGVTWKNNDFTGPGTKVFVPGHITFNPPDKAQDLAAISVIHQSL